MPYNSQPTVDTLAAALAQDAGLRQNAISRLFEQQSGQHNALKQFTSSFDPKMMIGSGPGSVFIEKTDLRAGGAQTVVFNTIGIPGGPGVSGDTELTGNTSTSAKGTYNVTVDWQRDGVEFTRDELEMLTAGRSLSQTSFDLLTQKAGLTKQNYMFRRLYDSADGNVFRPNNRASTDALLSTDTMSLDLSVEANARLTTLGAKPLMRNRSKTGCPVDNYLIFATKNSMLPIRGDSSFQTAISNADNRGDQNALFTGKLMDWQGNPFYEFPVTDQDWDDFKGGPLEAKAVVGVAAEPEATGVFNKLIVSAANTKSRYFQWFAGYDFVHNRVETPTSTAANTYYGWACNPDGSRVFFSYAGNHNGNQITLTAILSPAVASTTLDATTVGNLTLGTSPSVSSNVITLGTGTNLPTTGANGTWVYSNKIQSGAVIFQANANGVIYTRSFAFGAMAACFAHGRVMMNEIEQERDYGFVKGRGYEMIFGTGVTKNASVKKPVGYLVIEHAVDVPGYAVPIKN